MYERVKASINLHSILRNIEDLCQLDDASAEAVSDLRVAIRFSVPEIERLVLTFRERSCYAGRGDEFPYDMTLRFSSPEHFNLMVEGLRNIGFLKDTFTFLAGQLESYLKPDHEKAAKDYDYLRKSTILTAYAALYAIPEIARYDETGRKVAGKIEDGIINITVGDDFGLHLVAEKGQLRSIKGKSSNARAVMMFDTFETAFGLFNGKLESNTCIGLGLIAVRGRIPMIDNFTQLLGMVPRYLS